MRKGSGTGSKETELDTDGGFGDDDSDDNVEGDESLTMSNFQHMICLEELKSEAVKGYRLRHDTRTAFQLSLQILERGRHLEISIRCCPCACEEWVW